MNDQDLKQDHRDNLSNRLFELLDEWDHLDMDDYEAYCCELADRISRTPALSLESWEKYHRRAVDDAVGDGANFNDAEENADRYMRDTYGPRPDA